MAQQLDLGLEPLDQLRSQGTPPTDQPKESDGPPPAA
jgi:hypothetical protein